MSKLIAAVIVLSLAFTAYSFASTSKSRPLTSNAKVDLQRYMGRWWIIANIPYFAENGKVATADNYALKANGRIDNVFTFRKAFDQPEQKLQAEARAYPESNNNHWQVRFWGGLIRVQLLILEVSPDYQWAIIGNPDRSMAWVFSRQAIMDEAQLKTLTEKFRTHGYDPAKLVRVPQTIEQLPAAR